MSRSQPSALWAMTGSPNTSKRVSAVPYTLPRVFSGRLVQAAQASRACWLPISINAVATSSTSWTSTQRATSAMLRPVPAAANNRTDSSLGAQELPVVGVIGLVALHISGLGQHAADPPGVGVAVAVGEGGPSGAG